MEEKKTKQVGNITFGVLLITVGIALIASLFGGFDLFRYLYFVFPIYLISLGIEVLICDAKHYVLRWSFWNVVFSGIIICASLFFGVIGTAFHYVVTDKAIENKIHNEIREAFDIETEDDEMIEIEK